MTKEQFEKILDSCIHSDNLDYILEKAKEVADSRDPYFICSFPEHVQNKKLTKEVMSVLETGIVNTKEWIPIYEFMFEMTDFEIKNFNIELFEDLIIKSNNPKLMYYSIIFAKGTNVPKMLKALYETKNEKYIRKVKEDYEESYNKEEYPEDVIFDSTYNEALKAAGEELFFPESLKKYREKGESIETIVNKVIAAKDPYGIIEAADYCEYLLDYFDHKGKFGEKLEGHIKKLNEAIKQYGDVLHKYEYAWSIDRSNKLELQKDIIDSGDVKFMFYFRDIEGANREELDKAIDESGNIEYIDKINNRERIYDEEVPMLDSYPVRFQPANIGQVVKMIKGNYSGKEELYLFTNCICNVEIDGISVARQYDNLIYSKEAGVALLLSRELNPQDLVDVLDRYDIPYEVVAGKQIEDDYIDDKEIPEFYPVGNFEVLKEATNEAKATGITKADIYVNTPWKFRLGYREVISPEKILDVLVYDIKGVGIVDTGQNCSLIIDNGSKDNILPTDLKKTVEDLGLIPTVIEKGHPEYVKEDESVKHKL